MNGLFQLDYSVCRANVLQTPKYKHGKRYECGIARIPHHKHLCASGTRSVRGSSQPGKHLWAVTASSKLSAIQTPRGQVTERNILEMYKMPTVSALLADPDSVSRQLWLGRNVESTFYKKSTFLMSYSHTNYYFHCLIRKKNINNIHCIFDSLFLYGKHYLCTEKKGVKACWWCSMNTCATANSYPLVSTSFNPPSFWLLTFTYVCAPSCCRLPLFLIISRAAVITGFSTSVMLTFTLKPIGIKAS